MQRQHEGAGDHGAERGHGCHRGERNHEELQQRRADMGRIQAEIGGKACEHADREHIAVGELDDIEHAEEQGEADRD